MALSGGTGSAKLLRGLAAEVGRFTVVANVGDNVWMHGLYVCPDIDIATYTLAGLADTEKGWGLKGDTFALLDQLARLGEETWFKLGDRDLALHLTRTRMLREGRTLTDVTGHLARTLGVRQQILPPTDDHIETRIATETGEMHLQEFWVKNRGGIEVSGIRYQGAETAKATPQALTALREAERLVVCPANPVTSVMPILAVPGIREAIYESRARKVAISPMVGPGAYSGPAPKFMKALGHATDSVGVAKLYSKLVDTIVVDSGDSGMVGDIEATGLHCKMTATAMKGPDEERSLARFAIGA